MQLTTFLIIWLTPFVIFQVLTYVLVFRKNKRTVLEYIQVSLIFLIPLVNIAAFIWGCWILFKESKLYSNLKSFLNKKI